MELLLERRLFTADDTIGTLWMNGARFCDTLEDRVRDLGRNAKVPGLTAIPPGTYPVIVAMSPRLGRLLPRLLDVEGFEGILIHRGNTAEDTSGCILVGRLCGPGRLADSTAHEKRLTALIQAETDAGGSCTITVR